MTYFYYTDGKNYMAYKEEHPEYTPVTQEEFEAHLPKPKTFETGK